MMNDCVLDYPIADGDSFAGFCHTNGCRLPLPDSAGDGGMLLTDPSARFQDVERFVAKRWNAGRLEH